MRWKSQEPRTKRLSRLMHNFEKLIFWKKSILLANEIYLMSTNLPHDEKFGLISQMKRCAISIPSNIAEGSGINSNKEFDHILAIALGSAYELQSQLILTKELNLISNDIVETLLSDLIEIQKMIYGFKTTLKV